MNFLTIKHLFLADGLRLRWLILAVLVLVVLQTLGFLFYGPWDLPFPSRVSTSNLPPAYGIVGSNWPDLSFPFAIAAGLLAAAVGWQGASVEAARPVRRREKLTAKLFFLTVFLFLPQAAAILLVLCSNGIGSSVAFRAMVAAAGAFVPLGLLIAAYGRLAGSFWRFSGAVLLTFAAVFLAMILAAVMKWDNRP